jgi:hypothetical protein
MQQNMEHLLQLNHPRRVSEVDNTAEGVTAAGEYERIVTKQGATMLCDGSLNRSGGSNAYIKSTLGADAPPSV